MPRIAHKIKICVVTHRPTPSSTLFPYTTLFRSPVYWRPMAEPEYLAEVRKLNLDGLGARSARLPDHNSALFALLGSRSEEHTSELQSHSDLVCRLQTEKNNSAIAQRAYGDAEDS